MQIEVGENVTGVPLRDLMTIIIITSPIRCHPSTELMDRMLAGINKFVLRNAAIEPKLNNSEPNENSGNGYGILLHDKVRVLIVCDNCSIVEGAKKNVRIFGKASKEQVENYEKYKENMKQTYIGQDRREYSNNENSICTEGDSSPIAIIEMKSWNGFALCLREAVLHYVTTPHVLVTPHDLEFNRVVSIDILLAILSQPQYGVHYIGFPNPNNLGTRYLNRANVSLAGTNLKITDLKIQNYQLDGDAVSLVPLLLWKDNTHLCTVKKYKEFVYNEEASGFKFVKGDFMEDRFGMAMRDAVKKNGMEAHWGTYLIFVDCADNGETETESGPKRERAKLSTVEGHAKKKSMASLAYTYHSDGRSFLSTQEKQKLGYPPLEHEVTRAELAVEFVTSLQKVIYK